MEKYLKTSLLSRAYFRTRTWLDYHLRFKKRIASTGKNLLIWGIWNIEVYGPNIRFGNNVVIIGANGSRTRLTTVKMGNYEGAIEIGDNVLVMNAVRISSASRIIIGDDCMLASNCYLTDADWHDIHDRTKLVGDTAPIILDKGVWIGDSAIICKGVRIGENSVVGAGSVVRRNVPPNVVVAGNPARIMKKLDPKRVVTMGSLYKKYGWQV